MENSSYSKTRSPARFLAAFLAFVMVLIVMPVLPVGAASVSKITFKNVSGDNVVAFFSDSAGFDLTYVGEEGEGPGSWGISPGMVTYSDIKKVGDNVEITLQNPARFSSLLFYAAPKNEDGVITVYAQAGSSVGQTTVPLTNGYYKLPNAFRNATENIEIWAVEAKKTYKATFAVDVDTAQVTFNGKATHTDDVVEVEENSALEFKVENVPEGMMPSVKLSKGLTATVTPVAESSNSYDCKTSTVNTDFSVTVTLVKKSYTVQLNVGSREGYRVNKQNGPYSVDHGDSFDFTVTTLEGYNDPKVEIKKGGVLLEETAYDVSNIGLSRTFTIFGVTDNLTIEITAPGKKQFNVTFASGDGFDVNEKKVNEQDFAGTATYEEVLSFVVKPKEGWQTTTPNVTANGIQISPDAGGNAETGWTYKYTVTADVTISISNFERKTYNVTITHDNEKYTLTSYSPTVRHGEGFVFTLNLAAPYEVKETLTVNCEGAIATADAVGTGKRSFTVTVTSATGNVSIFFGGIEIKKHTVTVKADSTSSTTEDMYTVTSNKEQTISYGNQAVFTIKPAKGYRIVHVYERDSDKTAQTILQGVNNVYTSSTVTDSNKEIIVQAEIITYTVNYQMESSATFTGWQVNGNVIKRTYTVKNDSENGQKVFTVSDDGTVTLDLKNVTPTRDGWKFDGWENASNGVSFDGVVNSRNSSDFEYTLRADWKVNTSEDADGENAFFGVSCAVTKKDDVTNFSAKVHTNLDVSDVAEMNGQVSVVAYGIFYGETEELITATFENAQKTAATINQLRNAQVGKTVNANAEGGKLYYYKFNLVGTDAMTNNSEFKFHLKGTKNREGYYGSAWVILRIIGAEYLFVSTPDPADE